MPHVEIHIVAFYHATNTALAPLDRTLYTFLCAVGLDSRTAFCQYNLAPLALRRDIAMLGLLHRCACGEAPASLCSLVRTNDSTPAYWTRRARQRHNRQLQEDYPGHYPATIKRSLFSLIRVYNRLPPGVVEPVKVSTFQKPPHFLG